MNTSHTQHQTTQTIAILQYNIRKRQIILDTLLNSENSKKYAIILLQEQYTYKDKTSPPHQSWTLIESKRTENKAPRAAIYLNNRILPAYSYEPVPIELPDIVAIALRMDQEQHPTLIINVYNTRKATQLTKLRTQLRKH